jgi:hypothetical protein
MKTLLLTTALLLTLNAFGSANERLNQKKANEIVAVLESKEVLNMFGQVGALKSVEYMFSGRAIFGPAIYKLKFRPESSHAAPCVAIVQVDMRDNSVRSTTLKCE